MRYGEPVSRAAVGGVEVSRRHNAPFVQALKDFITADSECTLPMLGVGLSRAHEVLACCANKDRLAGDSGK